MTIEAGTRKPIDRDNVIIVIGEPSSGTRLIRRLIDASPDLDAMTIIMVVGAGKAVVWYWLEEILRHGMLP